MHCKSFLVNSVFCAQPCKFFHSKVLLYTVFKFNLTPVGYNVVTNQVAAMGRPCEWHWLVITGDLITQWPDQTGFTALYEIYYLYVC